MTANPEQSVLDAINALVDEQMAGGEYAAERRAEVIAGDLDRCALCKGAWHGSPWTGVDHDHLGEYDRHNHGRALSCPGAFATGPQRIRYRWQHHLRWPMRRSMGREDVAARMFGNLGDPIRELVDGDPMQRCYRQLQAARDFIDALTGDGPALEQWQCEQRASWLAGATPNLPPEVQFPRPPFVRPPFTDIGHLDDGSRVFVRPMGPRGDELRGPGMGWLDEAYTMPLPEVMRAPRGPMPCTVEPVTLPEFYMVPGRGGRQSVTHPRPNGLALLRYWGSPQAPGTWRELDGLGTPWGPWINVAVTREQDEPPRRRQGRGSSWPPLQRVFIELTAASGLHVNPIGLIAVGHGGPGASGTVRRAYLKSLGDHPPLLYDDERRTSAWQPTLWRWRGDRRTRPERLVDAIRGAEGL
ncbi:hypothetical protein [Mycobacteroides abscessus]|uniref:hypothetical protein n=1 Tax=Mycobacteroides abscessus TaxID=36809 RepID=UPI0009296F12|nr:hypothetical protein [Mycobacteroides abscessus]SIN33602.1 Uncharacterised protein [Mycobacteroides abscessus subsp. abscessus]